MCSREGSDPLEHDDRNAIAVRGGYQYQNVLNREITADIAEKNREAEGVGTVWHGALASVAEVGELDFPVETTGTEKRRVEGVGTVGGHDDLDVRGLVEAVHLVQKLK